MSGTTQSVQWRFPMLDTSSDKSGYRTGCDPNRSFELVNVDGSNSGAIRPFHGFRLLYDFTDDLDPAETIAQAWPFILRFGETGYTFGVLVNTYDSNLKLFQWNSTGTKTVTTVASSAGAVDGRVDMVPWGRYLYVLRKGLEPILITFDDTTAAPSIQTDTGPGTTPALTGPFTTDPGSGEALIIPDPTVTGGTTGQYQCDYGDYVFAYQFFDSRTGRKSQLSTILPVQSTQFPPIPAAVAPPYYYPSFVRIRLTTPDLDRFDKVYLYRSVKVQSTSGIFSAGIMFLDTIQDLQGIEGSSNIYYYMLQDKVLLQQEPFLDKPLFDEEMPLAGAGIMYEGTLITGSSVTTLPGADVPITARYNVAQVRWSSVTDACPELFPAFNLYRPQNPSDDIWKFHQVGPNVLGLSSTKQYLIRKESLYLKVLEMHSGFGSVGPFASEVVGSFLYLVTPNGLKAVDSTGNLDDIRSVTYLIKEEWDQNLASSISLAYDPFLNLLVINHPAAEGADASGSNRVFGGYGSRQCLLWLGTSKVTELRYCNFAQVLRGWAPSSDAYSNLADWDATAADEALRERALFLDKYNRMWTIDADRENVVDNPSDTTFDGQPLHAMFEHRGYSVLTVASVLGASTLVVNGPINMPGSRGFPLVVLTGAAAGKVIWLPFDIDTSTSVTVDGGTTGIVAGDLLGVAPKIVNVIGHPLGVIAEDGTDMGYDYMRVKHVAAMGASFSDIDTLASVIDSRLPWYRLAIYKDNDSTPYGYATPRENSGAAYQSLVATEPSNWGAVTTGTNPVNTEAIYGVDGVALAPAFQCFMPLTDYRLLDVRVDGKIKSSQRTRGPS